MKFLASIFNTYLHSSLHVAVAVFSMFQTTKTSLNNFKLGSIDFFIFFSTIIGYNFLKYQHFFKSRKTFSNISTSIKTITFFAFCGLVFCVLKMSLHEIMLFLPIGIVVAQYPKIRKNALLKIISVAACVSFVTVYIPSYNSKQINLELVFICIQRFLFCLIWLIPFEIIDSKTDEPLTKTIITEFGVSTSKKIGYTLVVCCFLLQLFTNLQLIEIIILIISALALFFCNENRSKYYSIFWVEAIPILWWILVFFKMMIKIS